VKIDGDQWKMPYFFSQKFGLRLLLKLVPPSKSAVPRFSFHSGFYLSVTNMACVSFTLCDESGVRQFRPALPKFAAGLRHSGFSLPAASAPLL
jgi:hypothetical protein